MLTKLINLFIEGETVETSDRSILFICSNCGEWGLKDIFCNVL